MNILKSVLSSDFTSGNDITPCNKMDKPLAVYRLSKINYIMTSIITLPKKGENLDDFHTKSASFKYF